MRADWLLADGTHVEYAGLMNEPAYASKMEQKVRLADALGIPLMVLLPHDLNDLSSKFHRFTRDLR